MGYDRNDCWMTCGQRDDMCAAMGLDPLLADFVDLIITDAMVDAAARVMWSDRDARLGGTWESRSPNEVVVIQTRATARAALAAAYRVRS